MDIPVLIYAGSHSDADRDNRFANSIRLYSASTPDYSSLQHFGIRVEVPTDLLSPAARRLLDLMENDLSGGRVSLGSPRLMIRRRRVGVRHAAEALGIAVRHAQVLLETYGEDSVGEAIVCEDVGDGFYPRATSPALLAREINRLADRAGLIVRSPQQREEVVNVRAEAIDETRQVKRWLPLLKRAALSAEHA